jgi:hypothetical protein
MALIRRPGARYEIGDMFCRCDIGLALQFSDKSVIPHVLDRLDRAAYGLHLRYSDGNLISVPSPAPRYRLPNQVRDLHRAAQWLNEHHPLNYSDRLACLGYNDSKVVFNVTHSYADGGHFKYLIDQLFETKPIDLPPLPPTLEEVLPKEFAAAKHVTLPWTFDPDLARFTSHHATLVNPSKFIKYETLRFSGDEVKCFNPAKRRFENTTDYLWLSELLAIAVHSGRLPELAGVSTCVDTRSYLKKPYPEYSLLKCFTQITASTPLLPNLTLREVGRRMRQDMLNRRGDLHDIARLKYCNEKPIGVPKPGLVMEISNMGPVALKGPLVEVWTGLNMHADVTGDGVSIMSFSANGPKKNELVMRFRYSDAKIGEDEALAIAKSLKYFMRNISLDRTVQSAFEELREAQKSS